MPVAKGYKQSPEHIARRIAKRYANGPTMTDIACRFCGQTRSVPAHEADRHSTCGAPDCVRQRRVEGGSRSKGKGEANPRFKSGRWTRGEKPCEICGVVFFGPAKRRYCSVPCSAKAKAAAQAGQSFSEERKARMRGRSGTGPKSEAWKDRASERLRGDANPNWLGGRRADMDRTTRRYAVWRCGVLERDNHTCQICTTTENIIAHHIKEWRPYPDLRYVIENGIALCVSCHVRLHRGRISLVLPTGSS